MKHFKKGLALFLACISLLAVIPIATVSAYNVGDIVEYGNYPQTRITDQVKIDQFVQLEESDKAAGKEWSWTSYKYTSGNGNRFDGQMKSGDFMTYHDFTKGTEKYRAVKITSFRPYYVGYESGVDALKTYQDDNGYYYNNVYYFHFEPLKWRVLNPSTGLIICQSIIDAQPFQSVVFAEDELYYSSSSMNEPANDYKNSSIRNWIIRDFFDTAFTRSEQMSIPSTQITFADGSTASERVFLPSINDVTNGAYGFAGMNVADGARRVSGTDYAKCQGLYKTTDSRNGGLAPWWLRDSAQNSGKALYVTYEGKAQNETATVDLNYVGVRPVCCINGLVSEAELCPYCNQKHGNSFLQRLIAFWHKIFAFIRRTDKNMG